MIENTDFEQPDIVPQHIAAKKCGISRSLVGVWLKREKIEGYNVEGERFVSAAEVAATIYLPRSLPGREYVITAIDKDTGERCAEWNSDQNPNRVRIIKLKKKGKGEKK